MSVELGPMMVSMGVSAPALASRFDGGSAPSWSQRLAATKATYVLPTGQAAATSQVHSSSVGAPTQESYVQYGSKVSNRLDPSVVAQTRINPQQYTQLMNVSMSRLPGPRAKLYCSSLQLDTSKLMMPTHPSLTQLDFQAIADSSVGGAGLPRPYGRFGAARNGDGTAVWERLPPEKASAWQSKSFLQASGRLGSNGQLVLDVDQAVHGTSETSPPASSKPASPSKGVARPNRLLSPLKARDPTGSFARSGKVSMARAGDTAAPPPAPASERGGFALPAATFLTEIPGLPANVRVDCGYNASRDFLLSGLHRNAQIQQSGQAPQHAQQPMEPPTTSHSQQALAAEPSSTASQGYAANGEGLHAQSSVLSAHAGAVLQTAAAPQPAAAAAAAADVPGYRRVYGNAFVPVDERTESLVRSGLEVRLGPQSPLTAEHLGAPEYVTHVGGPPPNTSVSPPAHAILSVISDAHHNHATTIGVAPDLATSHRRVKALPPEHALPRRHVPGVGR
mmetsp:Transcript_12279/g.26489  ORF Transcript_12279/g.26489 Transcript_12279/m.26489 type:complete len:507 (+) Transcript_12279:123-1643(+)